MIFNYFDFLVIFILVFINIFFWKKRVSFFEKFGDYFAGFLLFTLALPIISIILEFKVFNRQDEETLDSFTMSYTFLKFPMYWQLMILQIICYAIKCNRDKRFGFDN
jgi:hypothetical protein